ncbi:hypothetical protein F5888DRAFT_1877770 [Russula emetica]|nr:hypothetical protein F5888DRAFT_1877770 [Russula emetica]
MFTLHPNRSLLNPKFEGYKLDPVSSEDTVARHALKHTATQASVSGRHHLSFQETESRIRHNHLTVSPDGEQAVYIDKDLSVISVRLDHHRTHSSHLSQAIYDIPQPAQTPVSDSSQREYPSSVFLDAQTLICADGYGTLHVLTLSSTRDSARHLGVYELPSTLNPLSSSPIPFRLHVALSADSQAIAVLSFKHLKEASPGASSGRKAPPVEFDVVAIRVPLQAADDSNVTSPLDILWHRRGANVPLYTTYDRRRSAFILVGGSPYRYIGQPAGECLEPSTDEFAPMPRASANDAVPVPVPTSTSPSKPPPYAWTQDSEEVTVALPYPSNTPKAHINVLFSSQTLTVLVQGNDDARRYAAARLWGGIAPSSSFWTWDAHGAQSYGLLTLHLEKQHAGTRWPHLFDDSVTATTTSSSSSEQMVSPPEQVPETLDPSELYAIRENLEKYTAALQESGSVSGGAMRSSSLTDGEMDEEVDASVGTQTCITWVAAADGSDPAFAHVDWDVPFTVLSTPLPGISDAITLVVKHTIDGLSFALSDEDAANETPTWTHLSTFSALAFVLASKRDTRFTYHVPSKAVLAFESGGIEYGGNLYIYRGAKPKSNLAKQAILKLTGSTSGSLLGVGAIRKDEESIILCLCEKELLILRNML